MKFNPEKPAFKVKETEVKTVESTPNISNPFASKECIDILNFRIQNEEQSSRLYQSMSLWLNDNGFIDENIIKTYDLFIKNIKSS